LAERAYYHHHRLSGLYPMVHYEAHAQDVRIKRTVWSASCLTATCAHDSHEHRTLAAEKHQQNNN
jgi:hypothetical protein